MKIEAIENLEPIPAGENPFWHDLYSMGVYLDSHSWCATEGCDHRAKRCVMFDSEGRYLIYIDMTTGERVKLHLKRELNGADDDGHIWEQAHRVTGYTPEVRYLKPEDRGEPDEYAVPC